MCKIKKIVSIYVRKDMDVNEHEKLSNVTLWLKLKQRNSLQ